LSETNYKSCLMFYVLAEQLELKTIVLKLKFVLDSFLHI
jgi:hypothetical protein